MARSTAPAWRIRHSTAALAAVAWLAVAAGASRAQDATPPPAVSLELDSRTAGARAAHRLTFDVQAGEAEVFIARLTYPDPFRFTGFSPPGPPETPVGAYALDFDADGIPERVRPVRALGPDSAYVDLLEDLAFSPDIDPRLAHTGANTFTLRLPFGGDANAGTIVAPVGARVTLILFSGPLVNPALGGSYTVTAEMRSVDPDTGGADDDAGARPSARRVELRVDIDGPWRIPFTSLTIDKFEMKPDGSNRVRYLIRGRYVPGMASDGIDIATESITIAFDGFSQTVPGRGLTRSGTVYHLLNGPVPGIEKVWIRPDGRFQIDARSLHPGAHGSPPRRFALRIGDDFGEAAVLPASAGAR